MLETKRPKNFSSPSSQSRKRVYSFRNAKLMRIGRGATIRSSSARGIEIKLRIDRSPRGDKATRSFVDPLDGAGSARGQRPDGTRHVHDAEITVVIFISAEIRPADIHGSTWKLACGV